MISVAPLELRLKKPFRIAHGTSTTRTNALVRLGDGLGEGSLPPYYPHDFASVAAYVDSLEPDSLPGRSLEDALSSLPPGPAPARAAVDIALHDHWAIRAGKPLYQLWNLDARKIPVSSVTLSIPDALFDIKDAVAPFRDFPLLKLKLGTGSLDTDEAIVREVRRLSDAQLCVDANGAWTVAEAAYIIPRLAEYGLLFVEQPLPADNPAAWKHLRNRLPSDSPLLIADESIQSPDDVRYLAESVDGINLKLAKTGGLRGAQRLIELARSLDLKMLLGCMVESSIAVTAAAHLAPLVDFTDLDGPFLLACDPFAGVIFDRGRLILPERPGLGVLEV